MRERRPGRLLRRLLPRGVAADAFEPALRELEAVRLEQIARAPSLAARILSRLTFRVQVLLLFLDCWRIVLADVPRLRRDDAGADRTKGKSPMMFLHALRQAFRRLLREPAFTWTAVLTLALGVGANVAVFAVVEAVLLRPLPYADADELVIMNHRDQRTGVTKEFIALGDYVDLAERQSSLEHLVAYGSFQTTLYGDEEPLQVGGLAAGAGLFEALRVKAERGRALNAEDSRPGAAPVAMLSHDLWQERFGGAEEVVGRSVQIGQQVRTIIGIAPRGFAFPPTATTDVIVPMGVPAQAPSNRKSAWIFALGRLRPGERVERATIDLAAISSELEAEHPEQNQATTYFMVPLRDALVGGTRQALVLLLAAVGAVLLIACANVANLQLARSLGRRRETAVRLALGAGHGQLAGLFLAESLVLALLAGLFGIALAHWGVSALVALVPAAVSVPGLADVRLNGSVLAFALGIAVVAALVFGLAAAATVRLEHAADALVTAGRATMSRMMRRATSVLVAAEVALAIVLLTGAGLILRSFAGLLSVDPGFRYESVLTTAIQLPSQRYAPGEARFGFFDRAFGELQALPGVEDVGAAVVMPLTGNNWTVPFERADQPVPPGERPPDVGWQLASGGFFRALQIPLIDGRLFDARDNALAPPVVIVSRAIEQRFFAGESAVGRRIRIGDDEAEIIGVVGDIRRAGLTDEPRADMYFPFETNLPGQVTLFLRTSTDASALAESVRQVLRSIEPNAAVGSVATLDEIAQESLGVTKLVLWLLGVFAGLALLLAATGIYGVMSYVVRQRTREIGTRMAVGATRVDILWLVLRQGASVAVAGIGVGLLAGLLATRSLRALLYGVTPSDPFTLLAAAGLLALTTVAACTLPALRASVVDPARTLSQS